MIKIKYNSFICFILKLYNLINKTSYYAITIIDTIHTLGDLSPEDIKHEYAHLRQIKELGVIKFYLQYLAFNAKYGYVDNPFEVQARLCETIQDPDKKSDYDEITKVIARFIRMNEYSSDIKYFNKKGS